MHVNVFTEWGWTKTERPWWREMQTDRQRGRRITGAAAYQLGRLWSLHDDPSGTPIKHSSTGHSWRDHLTLINTLLHRCASCETLPVVCNACWEITQDSLDKQKQRDDNSHQLLIFMVNQHTGYFLFVVQWTTRRKIRIKCHENPSYFIWNPKRFSSLWSDIKKMATAGV